MKTRPVLSKLVLLLPVYVPVQVAGALLSMGDAHIAQGDSELDGTGEGAGLTPGTPRVEGCCHMLTTEAFLIQVYLLPT